MRWPTVAVGEIAQQVRGVSYDKSQVSNSAAPGLKPVLRAGNIKDGSLLLDKDLVYVPDSYIAHQQLLKPGDIVIAASSGSIDVVGKAAQLSKPWEGSFGAFCKVVRPSSDRVNPRYLHHFFQSTGYRRKVSSLAAGVNINNLKNEHIDDLLVPLPPLEEQRRIAAILDKASSLSINIAKAIQFEDELNASLFDEIIGDPVLNPRGFPRVPLIDLCSTPDDIKCGPFGTQLKQHEFRESGVPLWGIKHVNRRFQIATNEFLDRETAERLSTYSLLEGDIVMTRKGTVGNCCVYPVGLPAGVMHSDLLRIRLDPSKCLSGFAAYQLHCSHDVKRQIDLISGGAIMAGINVGKLKNIGILVPGIDTQKRFESLVAVASRDIRQANASMLRHSLALMNSLSARFIGGQEDSLVPQ
jgi:type I restriction enzyme S subunit